MEISIKSAETLSTWANLALLLSLLVGVGATWAIIWTGNVKEAALKSSIAMAQEGAAKANAEAAEANAQAVVATLSLEKERVARLQLEERLAPRMLSSSQMEMLARHMGDFRGSAVDIVVYPTGSSDIGLLRVQLEQVFQSAGWTVRTWTMLNSDFVIGLAVATAPESGALIDAMANSMAGGLNSVGLATSRAPSLPDNSYPMPASGPAPMGPLAPIRLYIGTKPP